MKNRQNEEWPRIVVGVDGFESSRAALRWAIRQARLTGAVVVGGDRLRISRRVPAGCLLPTCPTTRRTLSLCYPRR